MAESERNIAASTEPVAVEPGVLAQLNPTKKKPYNRRMVVGFIALLLMGGTAISAPYIAADDGNGLLPAYSDQDYRNVVKGPSTEHWLGTDSYGRDVLSRVLHGGRVSLAVGLVATIISIFMGTLVGATSGYFGRYVDAILQRFTELKLVFPAFFLLILIVSGFGQGMTVLIVVLGLTSWPISARIIRGEVLKVKARDFILASQSVGATNSRIIVHHILPNILSVIIINVTIRVGFLILVEAGLSFLGLGIQEPQPSWGNMVAGAVPYLGQAVWLVLVPGFAIWATVMGFNLMGEGLRDLMDPRGGKGRAGGQM